MEGQGGDVDVEVGAEDQKLRLADDYSFPPASQYPRRPTGDLSNAKPILWEWRRGRDREKKGYWVAGGRFCYSPAIPEVRIVLNVTNRNLRTNCPTSSLCIHLPYQASYPQIDFFI